MICHEYLGVPTRLILCFGGHRSLDSALLFLNLRCDSFCCKFTNPIRDESIKQILSLLLLLLPSSPRSSGSASVAHLRQDAEESGGTERFGATSGTGGAARSPKQWPPSRFFDQALQKSMSTRPGHWAQESGIIKPSPDMDGKSHVTFLLPPSSQRETLRLPRLSLASPSPSTQRVQRVTRSKESVRSKEVEHRQFQALGTWTAIRSLEQGSLHERDAF